MWGHKKENNHWIHKNILLNTNIKENISKNTIYYIKEKCPLILKMKIN